jgi:hypothetical protein
MDGIGVGGDPPPSGELSGSVHGGLACSVYVLKLAHRDTTPSYPFFSHYLLCCVDFGRRIHATVVYGMMIHVSAIAWWKCFICAAECSTLLPRGRAKPPRSKPIA